MRRDVKLEYIDQTSKVVKETLLRYSVYLFDLTKLEENGKYQLFYYGIGILNCGI